MPNALSPRAPAVAPSPFRAEMVHAASLRDVLTGIFHHGRAIVLTIGTIMAAGLLATLLMRPSYRAQTRLLALDSAAYGAPLAAGEKFSLEQSMAPYRIADVEMQLLGSAEVTHDAAALNLPPGANADAVAREAARIARHMHVGRPIDSPVIELTYSDSTPEAARETLQHILAAHLARRSAALTAGRFDYLFRQRAGLDEQRRALDARILAYESAHHIDDAEGTRAGAIAAAADVDLAGTEITSQIAGNRDAIARLRAASHNAAGPSAAAPNTATDVPLTRDTTPAAATIANLRVREAGQLARRADLATRYMPGSPIVLKADAALAEADAAITGDAASVPAGLMSGPDPVAQASAAKLALAEAQAAGDAARRDALARLSTEAHRHLDQLIADAPPLARMLQQRQVLDVTYAGLSQQLEEARKFETPDTVGSTNLRILSPPEVLGRSNSPAMVLAASLFAAIMVAINAVLVLTSLRDTFLIPVEVERTLGVPVLFTAAAAEDARHEQEPSLHRLLAAIHHARPLNRGVVVAITAPEDNGRARGFTEHLLQTLERRARGRTLLVRLDDTAPLPAPLPATLPADSAGFAIHPLEATAGTILDQLVQRFDTVLLVGSAISDGSEVPVMAQAADLAILVLTAGVSSRGGALAVERQMARYGQQALAAVLLERRHYIPRPLYRLLFATRRRSPLPGTIAPWARRGARSAG